MNSTAIKSIIHTHTILALLAFLCITGASLQQTRSHDYHRQGEVKTFDLGPLVGSLTQTLPTLSKFTTSITYAVELRNANRDAYIINMRMRDELGTVIAESRAEIFGNGHHEITLYFPPITYTERSQYSLEVQPTENAVGRLFIPIESNNGNQATTLTTADGKKYTEWNARLTMSRQIRLISLMRELNEANTLLLLAFVCITTMLICTIQPWIRKLGLNSAISWIWAINTTVFLTGTYFIVGPFP